MVTFRSIMKSRLQGFFEGLNISANEPTFGGYIVPDLGSFEIPSALVRPVLNNGRDWNHPGKPMPRVETLYPQHSFKEGVPIPKHKDMLEELRGQSAIGNNLTPAPLPFYPEDARVKALVEGNQARENALREAHHPPVEPPGFLKQTSEALQMRGKYTPEQFDKLIALGFTEEQIAKAVEEEINKDIKDVLSNPGAYTRELDIASTLDSVYEGWISKRKSTQTGTDGATFGSDIQNLNVYKAAGTLQENVPIVIKTGMQRMMQQQEENAFVKATREKFPPGAKVNLKVKEQSSLLASMRDGSNAAGGGGGGEESMLRMPEQKKKPSVVQKYSKK
jgi:hypothetical protein